MAAWKFEATDGSNKGAQPQGDAQPLFGNFRRNPMNDENGDKPRSMSEMWGFNSAEERREARRRRFWAAEPAAGYEHQDDAPWEQFRTSPPPPPAAVAYDEPVEAEAEWVEEDFAGELPIEEAGFDAEFSEPAYVEPAAPTPLAAPVTQPASGARNGWRAFLAESAPAVERPRTALPSLARPGADHPELERDESVARLARRLSSVASAHPLQMETSVQLEAAVQTCTRLAKAWGAGFEPTVADIAIRSLARALKREPALQDLAGGIAVLDLGAEQGVGSLLESPGERPFKDIVGELAAMDGALLEEIDVSVTDYGLLSIERATPRLAPGQWLAISLGARTFGASPNGEMVSWRPVANICLAYDGQLVSDGAAARLLSRLRTLMEAPEELIS